MRTVNQAFQAFVQATANTGASLALEGATSEANRTARLIRNEAELRLSWIRSRQHLLLEISHGPSLEPSVGWLELYGTSCNGEALPNAGELDDAIAYGLELMGFRDWAPPKNV